MERTKWLDGLRGIAATIVAFDHFFMSDVWHPFVSFWTEPPEANRHLVQLPPIRIIFSAHGMVTLFMVISGYAISISLLKARDTPQFLSRMSSAIVRRIFRIYLPVLVTATLAQVLFFFDLYHWEFDEGLLNDLPKPWTAPFAHIQWLLNYMADSINVIAFEYRGGLNGQLWTMPLEFRGSNLVYLLITGLSAWRKRSRLYVLPAIGAFFLWYGNWDIFGFIWGLWLAERAAAKASSSPSFGDSDHDSDNLTQEYEMAEFEDEAKPTVTLPLGLSLPLNPLRSCRGRNRRRHCSTPTSRTWTTILSRIGIALTFCAGYYLLCLGNDGHLPPGYQFLSVLQPSRWKDNWNIYQWCWKTIGSAMLVFAIGEFRCLQRPLNSRLVQYLGKISFALYLLHETVYELFRNPLRDLVFSLLSGGKEYGTSGEALGADPLAFHLAWWGTGVVLGVVVVAAAHFYTVWVDERCVALAKRVDHWFSGGS